LALLNDVAGSRQLKQNRIGLNLTAGPGGADAEVQTSSLQNALGFKAILADYIGDFYFRTAK
jgi:hypothetical protein